MKTKYFCSIAFHVCLAGFCPAEFQVNTHTTYDQKNADIAMGPAGNFVVVWSSYRQDGSSNGIFGRRFDPDCSPLGEEFRVNTVTAGRQLYPGIAS